MKKILKKLLICICIFLTLFNFVLSENTQVEATDLDSLVGNISSGVGADIADILSGIVGLLTWGLRLPFAITPLIFQSVGGLVAGMEGTIDIDGNPVSFGFEDLFLTPATVIFNRINLTSIDFFNLSTPTAGSATHIIREQIALWYLVMRLIAIAILLGILIFVGIKMAISTVASEKAIYKKALFDWLASLALVFLLHYIIRGILWINTGFVKIMNGLADDAGIEAMLNTLRGSLLAIDFVESTVSIIIYIMITVQGLMFLISYIKRMLTLAFLIIISPLITITYSIDKMGDQKAQALNTWLKEFSYNVLIQPFHCILYIVFVSAAIKLLGASGANIGGGLLAILCIKFVWDGEKIVRKIFGFEQASSLAAAAASGAVVGSMIGKAQSIGKGAASGIKFAKNSKAGQAIKEKVGQKRDLSMKNKAAQLITGNKNATYSSLTGAQREEADKQVSYKKEQRNKTPIRRLQEKMEFDKLKRQNTDGKNELDLRNEAAKNVDKKKLNFQNNHKILSSLGNDAGKFTRKLVAPENIAKFTAGASVAAAMYAMPDSNLVTSIGAGYAAGKSASSGVKRLKENKKERFEENIMKAWNNHCNITGNNKNSKQEFNKWYENTYSNGKQLDSYSQKNMGKAEGIAKKDLQELGLQSGDIDSIVNEIKRAILSKQPYDPAKMFEGYSNKDGKIDPSVIAAAVAAYAAQFNASYAYKNASDYNEQMGQFGVSADDAINGISDSEFKSYLTPDVQAFAVPEQVSEIVETSVNTSEQLENQQFELVTEELIDANNSYGNSGDMETILAGLQSTIDQKIRNIETTINNNLSNIGFDRGSNITSQIQAEVANINPNLGSLEGQINNIVSNGMSKIDFRRVPEEQRTEIQSNLREYTNKQVINNYMTNNYGSTSTTNTTNVGVNVEKIRSDLEKIASNK